MSDFFKYDNGNVYYFDFHWLETFPARAYTVREDISCVFTL